MKSPSPPPPHTGPLQPLALADSVADAAIVERTDPESLATIVKQPDAEQAPAPSNGSRSSTSELPVEQIAQDLMDISSNSEEEGEITNNLQQEMTDETTAYETEQGDTDEQLTKGSIYSTTRDDYSRSRRVSSSSAQEGNPLDASQLIPPISHTVKSSSMKTQTQGASQILTKVEAVPTEPVDSPREPREGGSPSNEPHEPEVFEDTSDLADSDIYEPPEPIATASTETGKPDTPPLSPVLANATSLVEEEKELTPTAVQGRLSTSAAFETVEISSTVDSIKVRARFLPTLASICSLISRM